MLYITDLIFVQNATSTSSRREIILTHIIRITWCIFRNVLPYVNSVIKIFFEKTLSLNSLENFCWATGKYGCWGLSMSRRILVICLYFRNNTRHGASGNKTKLSGRSTFLSDEWIGFRLRLHRSDAQHQPQIIFPWETSFSWETPTQLMNSELWMK